MALAQLVVFIEKHAGECMTPSPPEERNWSQKGFAPCGALAVKVKAFYCKDDEPCASLYPIEVSRTLP